MEVAEVGRLVSAALGGGIAGAYLDHVWANRNARKASLRPVDMDRIAIVRQYTHRVFVQNEDLTPELKAEIAREVGPAILDLADKKLAELWMTMMQSPPDSDECSEAVGAVFRRLNRLERKR